MSEQFKRILIAEEVLALAFGAMLAVLLCGVAVLANQLEIRPQ
jgi:hypothetical protein